MRSTDPAAERAGASGTMRPSGDHSVGPVWKLGAVAVKPSDRQSIVQISPVYDRPLVTFDGAPPVGPALIRQRSRLVGVLAA